MRMSLDAGTILGATRGHGLQEIGHEDGAQDARRQSGYRPLSVTRRGDRPGNNAASTRSKPLGRITAGTSKTSGHAHGTATLPFPHTSRRS